MGGLQKDEGDPLVNRAISALPPGSTFKIVTSFAGLRKNIGQRQVLTAAAASVTAITTSTAGSRIRAAATARSAWPTRSRFRATPIFINTATPPASTRSMQTGTRLVSAKNPACISPANRRGFCPGRSGWRFIIRRNAGPQAYTANVSIGQGYVLASPLQMAMAYAPWPTAGISYYPRFVDKVLNQDGTPALDEMEKSRFPRRRNRCGSAE